MGIGSGLIGRLTLAPPVHPDGAHEASRCRVTATRLARQEVTPPASSCFSSRIFWRFDSREWADCAVHDASLCRIQRLVSLVSSICWSERGGISVGVRSHEGPLTISAVITYMWLQSDGWTPRVLLIPAKSRTDKCRSRTSPAKESGVS